MVYPVLLKPVSLGECDQIQLAVGSEFIHSDHAFMSLVGAIGNALSNCEM